MIKEIELYVCDEDDIVLLSDKRDTHVCMECEKPMTLAKFERKLTKRTVDSPEPCGDYTPAFLIKGSPCLNCDADAESH